MIHQYRYFLVLMAGLCAPLSAQTRAKVLEGPQPRIAYGETLAGGGDYNGDGAPDLLVGGHNRSGPQTYGVVEIRSGRDADRILLRLESNDPDAEFGSAVTWLGDVDGDGADEFAVGSPGFKSFFFDDGKVEVYRGGTGDLLYAVENTQPAERLGSNLASAGDLDFDGAPDLLVSASARDSVRPGRVLVLSGRDGALMYYVASGLSERSDFGAGLASINDLDRDGYRDFLIGDPLSRTIGTTDLGRVWVVSGRTGLVMRSTSGADYRQYGASLAAVGDQNDDGYEDYLVGATHAGIAGARTGEVSLLSGKDDSVLQRFLGPEDGALFGKSVGSAVNITGDGKPEFLIGAPGHDSNGENSGSAFLYGSDRGVLLRSFFGARDNAWFGTAVSQSGWLHGASLQRPSVFVGAPFDEIREQRTGSATCFSLAVFNLSILFITPATAGTMNTARVISNAYEPVFLFWSARTGATPLRGCRGLTLQLQDAQSLGREFAGPGGAAFRFFVPTKARGRTIHFQAYRIPDCSVSASLQTTFR